MAAGDNAGAVKAFSQALAAVDASASAGRLHRRVAQAWLMQHGPVQAEEHLRAAEAVATDPAEEARLVCLRAHQAWEGGELERAQTLAERAQVLAQQVGDSDDLAAAQETLAIVSHLRGDWRHGLRFELERLAGDTGRDSPLVRVFDIHHCI